MEKSLFKWKHYSSIIIMLCVRWYFRYSLSLRDISEMMTERGCNILNASTIWRWCNKFGKELNKRIIPHLRKTNGSWRTDETYVKVKGKNCYLYRAVDKYGDTIDFYLSEKRDTIAAKMFFRKAIAKLHTGTPYVITTDKDKAYPGAIEDLKREKLIEESCKFRQIKYLNNIIESDHRRIKKLIRPCLGFKNFDTATNLISGFETMQMIKKGQLSSANKNIALQNSLINSVMGVAF